MAIPKVGETISKEMYDGMYSVGTTISAEDFQKRYGSTMSTIPTEEKESLMSKVGGFAKDFASELTKPIVKSVVSPYQAVQTIRNVAAAPKEAELSAQISDTSSMIKRLRELEAQGKQKGTEYNQIISQLQAKSSQPIAPSQSTTVKTGFWGDLEAPKTTKEVLGTGAKVLSYGMSPMAGGAAWLGGEALEQNKSLPEVAAHAAAGAALGKVGEAGIKYIGKGLQNFAKYSEGKIPGLATTATKKFLSWTSDTPEKAFDVMLKRRVNYVNALKKNITPEEALTTTQSAITSFRTKLSQEWQEHTAKVAAENAGKTIKLPADIQKRLVNIADDFALDLPTKMSKLTADEAIKLSTRINELYRSKIVRELPKGAVVRSLKTDLKKILFDSFGGEKGAFANMYKDYSTKKGILDAMDNMFRAYKTGNPIAQSTSLGRMKAIFAENKSSYLDAIMKFEEETGLDLLSKITAVKLKQGVSPLTHLTTTGGLQGTKGITDKIFDVLLYPLRSPRSAQAILRGVSNIDQAIQKGLSKTAGITGKVGAALEGTPATIRKIQRTPISELGEKASQKMPIGATIKDVSGFKKAGVPKSSTLQHDIALAKTIRESKGLNADDIMNKYPDIQLKKDIPAKDIHGNKIEISKGEALTPYELKGNKVLLQDGETYIVTKNQFQNIKGNSVVAEGKKFAPELKQTEETSMSTKPELTEADISWRETYREGGKNELLDKYKVIEGTLGDRKFLIEANDDGFYVAAVDKELGAQVRTYTDAINEVNRYLKKEQKPTKYSSYQLPGGKNYKEILIKAPANENPNVKYIKQDEHTYIFEINGKETMVGKGTVGSLAEAKEYMNRPGMSGQNTANFKSSHWDEPNVISHLRLNERTYNGKKVTFMEELQSDWAREGRSRGFTEQLVKKVEPKDVEVIKSGEGIYQVKIDGEVVGDTYPRRTELANKPNAEQLLKEEYANKHNAGKLLKEGGVPNNPLLKNWQELSVKRALKEAVDNNSEYLAWTTGEQQKARYNLAKQVDSIEWLYPKNGGDKVVSIRPISGSSIDLTVDKNGIITKGGQADWKGKPISEAIGKGIGERIMKEKAGKLSGEGLNIGGEWANNLYDKQIKNIVEDLTGQKVGFIDMGLPVDKGGKKAPFQQAIKITPEIRALVKGEAPKFKK